MRYFIDASNLTGTGGKIVGLNLLKFLSSTSPEDTFLYYLPDTYEFRELRPTPNTTFIFRKWPTGIKNNFSRLFDLHIRLPSMIKSFKADACLTLGDIGPIKPSCKHIIFVHQPMLINSNSQLSGRGSWSFIKRNYLFKHFSASLNNVSKIIVQTPIMARHIAEQYQFDMSKILVMPQPVPDHVKKNTPTKLHPVISSCSKPIKLLFLSQYYPHKNHAILPLLLRELKQRGMQNMVQIFTTLDEKCVNSVPYLKKLFLQTELITNLGIVPMHDVSSVLCASSALFLPTLAESYGLIYVEALTCSIPILTSDRDFARWMCKDLAIYFDPLEPTSIVDSITQLISAPIPDYASRAKERLLEFPRDWQELAGAFYKTLSE